MPQEILRQSNWNAGELDPAMKGRRDIKAYYATLEYAENLITPPQGPLRRRPGTRFLDRVRRVLEAVDASAATFTAPNGGDADNAKAVGGGVIETDVDMGVTEPYVALQVDFGAPVRVGLVDVVDYGAKLLTVIDPPPIDYSYDDDGYFYDPPPYGVDYTANLPAIVLQTVAVRYSNDGVVWTEFGPRCALGNILRTRRFGPGPRKDVTARYWQVVKVRPDDWGEATLTLDAVRFWRETTTVSAFNRWSFAFDDADQRYLLIATDRNVEVYHRDVRVASFGLPHTSAQIAAMTKTQMLDTLLAFYPDVPPQRVTRQGGHGEWDSRAAAFQNIPLFDFDGKKVGSTNEVQKIYFNSYVANDTFVLSLEDATTPPITYSATAATTRAAIEGALNALPDVGAGGVTVTSVSANEFTVTFQGSITSAQDWAEMVGRTIKSTSGGVTVATIAQGEPGGEPVMSDARGWPACGAFYQARLWMAGLKSRPQTALASKLGDYFNLNTKGATATSAISVDFDTDEATAIRAIFPGRHLQFFTSGAEFYIPSEPITPPPAVKQATRRGLLAGTSPSSLDGATAFLTRGSGAVVEFVYDDGVQSYTAAPLSVLSSHLIKGAIDFAFRPSNGSADRMDMAVLPRADGGATLMTALRSQDVVGFSRWTTAGRYLGGVGDRAGDLWLIVARMVDGEEDLFLEKVDDDAMLDSARCFAGDGETKTITGLDHLEGQTATLYIDGADAGDVVVTDGQVALPYAALRKVTIGHNFQPKGRTLPGVLQEDPRGGASMRARPGEIAMRVGPTGGLQAGLVGGRKYDMPMRRASITADAGPGEEPFSGWTRLSAVPGFREDAQVEFLQPRPGPLEIQEVVMTVQS